MKTCVFITGTNCVGKTTIAKKLQEYFGGIRETTKDTTYCNDSRACFAGIYRDGLKHGGVDALNQTKSLAGIVQRGLQTCDVVFCEGSYLDTFGQNLLNAIFAGQAQLYVYLHCNSTTLAKRNAQRANNQTIMGGVLGRMINRQNRTFLAAQKYASIGVPLMSFDTDKTTPDEIVRTILQHLGL